MPRKGSFKSSIRKKKKKASLRKKNSSDSRPFVIKPIPSPTMKPIIVFINPKSGGNQGSKIMNKCQSLLNPRQVFELSSSQGPEFGLDLFKKVNIKYLNFLH